MDEREKREYRPFWVAFAGIWSSVILGWAGSAVSGSLIPAGIGGAFAAVFTIAMVILAVRWGHRREVDFGMKEGLKSSIQVRTGTPPSELTAGLSSRDPEVVSQSQQALRAWSKRESPTPQIRLSRQQALSKSVDGGLPSDPVAGTVRCPSCNAQIPLESSKCSVCGTKC